MTVVLDAGVAVAFYDRADDRHAEATTWAQRADEDLVTTPLVLAEIDLAVERRGGVKGREVLWGDLDAGVYVVRWWADALRETLEIARRNPVLGLAEASLVALAGLLRTDRIATFNEHFRSLTTPGGEGFVLLPHDLPDLETP